MTKLKNSNCDKTKKKTQIWIKLENSNCDQTKKLIVTKLSSDSCDSSDSSDNSDSCGSSNSSDKKIVSLYFFLNSFSFFP